jgi:DNA replication and repair protein RecF
MHLQRLDIDGFRNLKQQVCQFPGVHNYIFGDNAQGKTNLLECIYLLCLTKSFRTHEEAELVASDQSGFHLAAVITDESHVDHHIHMTYGTGEGKKLQLDSKPVQAFSMLVGQFPVVKLSTEDHEITAGPPQQRRRFFNILLSQLSSRYLSDLKEYDHIVKQRNRVLEMAAKGHVEHRHDLEAWNDQLVHKAEALSLARQNLVEELNEVLQVLYKHLVGASATLRVVYRPHVALNQESSYADTFYALLKKLHGRELGQAQTLAGPHRDDFQFLIADRDVRRYASRGEHKSVLISLKGAEVALLRKKLDKAPLVLLDDLFAELDVQRIQAVLQMSLQQGQRFITGTSFDHQLLSGRLPQDSVIYWMRQGQMTQV